MRKPVFSIGMLLGACALTGTAGATQLVYTPVNPTFGGSGLNGSFLFQTGQAQGHGASGSGPNLTGLDNALNNLTVGTPIIINLPTTPTTPTNP